MATKDQDAELVGVIAAELRAMVARSGLKQETVADMAGMHRVTVNRLLNGSRSPDVLQLIDLAKVLNTTPGEILDAAQRQYERKKNARPNSD